MFTQERKLVAIIGLAQTGAICAAAAACRVAMRFAGEHSLQVLRGTGFMAGWGLLLLVLPLAWAVCAVKLAQKDQGEGARWFAVLAGGIVLAAAMLAYAAAAVIRPLMIGDL